MKRLRRVVAGWRRPAGVALLLALALAGGALAIDALDRAHPPDFSRAERLARVLVDRDGEPLRYRLAADERLRLAVNLDEVDPTFLAMLVAYEDKRFHRHSGVDALALLRATAQWLRHGRPLSGASTLTMQTARLLEPRPRTLAAKVIEMLRAWQIERRLHKQEILALYLTLAPYGGNIEGVVAASRHYFGKPPSSLTLGEAALLVALPQSPTRLRPDRHADAAREARRKVLARVWPRVGDALALDAAERRLAEAEAIAMRPAALPMQAPQLADRLFAASTGVAGIRSCLDRRLQQQVERIAVDAVAGLSARASVAVLVVHNASGEARAYVGGADYLDQQRAGQLDLVTAVRSPGSTLKPLIAGLAFDARLVAPATLVADVPTPFGAYVPSNFEGRFHGTVSIAEALRLSLNIPAVLMMDAIGPARFIATLQRHGVTVRLPDGERPGLAVALGGVGVTLEGLTSLYRAIADDGVVRAPRLRCDRPAPAPVIELPLLGETSRWHLARILRGVAAPQPRMLAAAAASEPRIAYKTGTSYGYRDAWAVGFDRAWTVGVWLGRPDGSPLPGSGGYDTAAPVLFQVFDALPRERHATPPAPRGALAGWDAQALPPALRMLRARDAGDGGPRLLFPLPGTTVLAGAGALPLEAQGGTPPYTWMIDGAPLATSTRAQWQWRPEGPGFVLATVVDGLGRADRVRFAVANAPDTVGGLLRTTP